jgi:hypothetical protein
MRQSISLLSVSFVWKGLRFFGEHPSPKMAAARMCAVESNRVAALGGIEQVSGLVRVASAGAFLEGRGSDSGNLPTPHQNGERLAEWMAES